MARYLFGAEPGRVVALIDRDPAMKVDRLASVMMEFEAGHASFVCSTQLVPYQRMQILGTTGRIEVEIPFNAPPDQPCRLFVDAGKGLGNSAVAVEEFATMDQYGAQGDAFAEAVRGIAPWEWPLEDAVANMRVLDATYRSGETGRWENV